MELTNDFTVNVPIEEAWATLTDLELIAPCMPGAQLTEIEGDIYRGQVKVKVGPILAQFKGEAEFLEKDDTNYKAVLKGKGRETGGKGNADALITAQLTSLGASTKVSVLTDLNITGKVAQFGRGALADVSGKLLTQFVENLETTVLNQPKPAATAVADAASAAAEPAASADTTGDRIISERVISERIIHTDGTSEELIGSASAASASTASSSAASSAASESPTVRKIESKEVEPLNLGSVAGGAMVKRFAPVGVAVVALLWWLIRRGG
jgi:uncharacterized protein